MNIGICTAFLFVVSASTALAQTPAASQSDAEPTHAPPIVKSLDIRAIDKSADPCTDFYQYACGNWIKDNPVPADQARWVRSFSLLQERNLYELRQELAKAATKPAGPLEKKYGDFFVACMDVAALEKKGLESLKPALERISALNDSKGIAALISDLAATGDPAPLFGLDVEPDQMDSSKYILSISQGGLTLDRENYTGISRYILKRYQNHIVRVFTLAGDTLNRAEAEAAAVLGIETALARASASRADLADPEKRYHIYSFADLQKLAPDFDFRVYLKRVTALPTDTVNVANPAFLKSINGLLAGAPVDAWKAYFRWHILSEQADALPKEFRDEDFAFWGGNIARQEKPQPRWKQGTRITDQAFGDAFAQDWVKQNFSPAAKAGMERMAAALEKALANEMRTLPWMSDETKKTAERKLAAIRNRIGYPKKWRDYSDLEVDQHDLPRKFSSQRSLRAQLLAEQTGQAGGPGRLGHTSDDGRSPLCPINE